MVNGAPRDGDARPSAAGISAFSAVTALVMGGGEGPAKALAILLGARGARLVVAGPEERRIGETVGEIVYGGGKARHVVGDPAVVATARAALEKADATFARPSLVVFATPPPADVLATTVEGMASPGRVLILGSAVPDDKARADAARAAEVALAAAGERPGITCICTHPRVDGARDAGGDETRDEDRFVARLLDLAAG